MIEPRPRPGLTGRPRIILIVLTICFVVMVLRLWSLQVVHASRYRELGLLNRKRGVTVRRPKAPTERIGLVVCRSRPICRHLVPQPELDRIISFDDYLIIPI